MADRPLLNRTAVITGSTRGIGLIMAQALVAAGANVVVSSRSETEAVCKQLAERAKTAHQSDPLGKVMGMTCDVTDLEQVEQLATNTKSSLYTPDIKESQKTPI